ncbi:hypothetical protein TESG_04197 [Trichophyton tonsurans CBS 112818]|uniref:Uncharacterized protein n=1 Tax=Trichophyton tonsurans (strain CBS 112818) TaxID=647933 RepID=F2RZL7_TRIT1|nr:hypothetical protein TESG_04197 [Trichophyton tonsurans CBS 112818]
MKRIRAAKYAALRKLVLKIHARAPRLARYHLQGLVMIDWRKGGFVHAGLLLGSPCVRMLVEENRASFPPSWRGDTSPQPCFADALYGSIIMRVVTALGRRTRVILGEQGTNPISLLSSFRMPDRHGQAMSQLLRRTRRPVEGSTKRRDASGSGWISRWINPVV